MLHIPEPESPELARVPFAACDEVVQAMDSIRADITTLGGPSVDTESPEGVCTLTHNEIARLCGQLCTGGCRLEWVEKAQTSKLIIPTTEEDEKLANLVVATLITDGRPAEPTVTVLELESFQGPQIKEILEKRLQVIKDLAGEEKLRDGEVSITLEDVEEFLPEIEDEAYEELAKFTKGDVRACLNIIETLIGLSSSFRFGNATDHEDRYTFKLDDPAKITSGDIQRLGLIVEDGVLQVPRHVAVGDFNVMTSYTNIYIGDR